ncbi:unnamed protein product, partial [Prorocentrum cordatum]
MGWTWNQTQSRPKICRPYVVCTSCGAWQYTSKAKKKVWCKCGEPFHIPDAGDKSTQASQASEKGAPQDQDMKSILTAILGVLSDAQKQELGPAAQSAAALVSEKKPAPAVAAVAALQRVRQHEKKVTELGIHVQELETQLQAAKDDRAKVTMELQEARQQFEAASQQATAQWGTAAAAEDAMEEDQEAAPKEAPAAEQPKASVPELPPGLRAAVSGLQGEDAEQAQAFVQQLEAATKAGKAPPPKRPPPKRQGAAGGPAASAAGGADDESRRGRKTDKSPVPHRSRSEPRGRGGLQAGARGTDRLPEPPAGRTDAPSSPPADGAQHVFTNDQSIGSFTSLVISQSDDIFSLSDSSESDLVNFDPSVVSVSATGDAGHKDDQDGRGEQGGEPLMLYLANITSWHKKARDYVQSSDFARPHVIMFSEMHVQRDKLRDVHKFMKKQGCRSYVCPAVRTSATGSPGGVGLFALRSLCSHARTMGAKGRDQPPYGGQGWTACHLRLRGHSLILVSTYLQSDAGYNEYNTQVTSQIATFLTAHKLPFIIGGDWNMTGKELMEGGLWVKTIHRVNLSEMWFELVESQPRLRNGIELAWPKVVTKLQRPRRRFEAGLADDSVCPLCGDHHCDDYHKFWGCPLLFQADHPLIQATEDLVDTAQGGDQPACLWLRGFVPAGLALKAVEDTAPQRPVLVGTGAFLDPPEPRGGWRLGSVDGSGGAFSSDPRLRRVGWGAGVWDEDLNLLGTLQGNVIGLQTINRAELKGATELLKHTQGDLIVVTDSAYLIRGYHRGPRRRARSNRRLWAELWRVLGARTGQVKFLKVKSHATDPEVRARFPAWALYVNEQADEFAGQAAASAAVPQDLVDRVLALDTLAEQVRGRLAAVQMMWWTHYPVEEAPAETKRAQRKERSDNAVQHLLEVTAHWPQARDDQVSCARCGKQTHRRCCARWLKLPCPAARCGCWKVRASRKFKVQCNPLVSE